MWHSCPKTMVMPNLSAFSVYTTAPHCRLGPAVPGNLHPMQLEQDCLQCGAPPATLGDVEQGREASSSSVKKLLHTLTHTERERDIYILIYFFSRKKTSAASATATTLYFLQIFLKRAAKPSAGNTSAEVP